MAVLPFLNVSGNPDTEYLSDGITETLINNLAQLATDGGLCGTFGKRVVGVAIRFFGHFIHNSAVIQALQA